MKIHRNWTKMSNHNWTLNVNFRLVFDSVQCTPVIFCYFFFANKYKWKNLCALFSNEWISHEGIASRKKNKNQNKIFKNTVLIKRLMFWWFVILPTGSVAPNTDEKLLSDTNALDCCAGAVKKKSNYFQFFFCWYNSSIKLM